MKFSSLGLVGCWLIGLCGVAEAAPGRSARIDSEGRSVLGLTGRVLVVVRDDPKDVVHAALACGATLETWLAGPHVAIFDTGAPAKAIELTDALRGVDGATSVEPDFIRPRRDRTELSDPLAREPWSAERTCLPAAFEVTMGDPAVVVAIIDDGFDLAHEDLGGFTKDAWDFADGDAVPAAGPTDDHGTAVLGIAVARAGNARGITGFCPRCGVLPIRRGFSDADDARAISYATDVGADVINCSWGYSHPSSAVTAALRHALVDGRHGLGAVVVFAAGNDGVDIAGRADIAATPGVLAVMATGQNDQLSRTSNTSPLGLAAPAGGGWTTDRTSGGYAAGPYTDDFGGTSAAAPAVAGTVGLVLSIAPTLSREAVVALLHGSSDAITTPGRVTASRLNAGRAVAWAAGKPDPSRDAGACVFSAPSASNADEGCSTTSSRSVQSEERLATILPIAVAVALLRRRRRRSTA